MFWGRSTLMGKGGFNLFPLPSLGYQDSSAILSPQGLKQCHFRSSFFKKKKKGSVRKLLHLQDREWPTNFSCSNSEKPKIFTSRKKYFLPSKFNQLPQRKSGNQT